MAYGNAFAKWDKCGIPEGIHAMENKTGYMHPGNRNTATDTPVYFFAPEMLLSWKYSQTLKFGTRNLTGEIVMHFPHEAVGLIPSGRDDPNA